MNQNYQASPNFDQVYNRYKVQVEQRLTSFIIGKKPSSVYEPIRYVLGSGGKRFRAVLVLLSCEAVGGKMSRALDAAAAIEILHNFTLVHDDVMDHADLRRGILTVHKKWDENVAILSGDEMIAQAYRAILETKSHRLEQILDVYTDALVQVCEGQGLDKEFEMRKNITLNDYFQMIAKKTGRVIAAAVEIGALIGGGTMQQVAALRKYGERLGKAFQIKDDMLDIIGDTKEFGKNIGGDIREGKKTYLLLKALERAKGNDRKILQAIISGNGFTKSRIEQVRNIYERSGALDSAKREMTRSTNQAQQAIIELPSSRAVSILIWLSHWLLGRSS